MRLVAGHRASKSPDSDRNGIESTGVVGLYGWYQISPAITNLELLYQIYL
jgi:hypothetical protein